MNTLPIESRDSDRVLVCREAATDAQLIQLWLGTFNSRHTIRGYRADADALLSFVGGRPLAEVRMVDIQAFAGSLVGAASSQARRLSGIKALMRFAQRIGYLRFDVAAPVPLPAIKDRLAERITSEEQTLRMFGMERRPRDAALLRLLYSSGLRISEVCSLRWADLVARDDGGGQFSVLGKGGRTRTILVPRPMWDRLQALRGSAEDGAPLFRSRKGGALGPRQVHDIVKRAAKRAGLPAGFSAHWLRHAHASHALDRGAPVHVVQATLGHASLTTTTRYTHARPGDSSSKYLVA